MEPLGLYVHIPFCRRKCYYCDFISFPEREDAIDAYVTAVNNFY
jgi:oxygen-independent coproporphyrinogen-3 oxidase